MREFSRRAWSGTRSARWIFPIPVLGYLDDLVLVPLGIALAVRMIPPDILTEYREKPGPS